MENLKNENLMVNAEKKFRNAETNTTHIATRKQGVNTLKIPAQKAACSPAKCCAKIPAITAMVGSLTAVAFCLLVLLDTGTPPPPPIDYCSTVVSPAVVFLLDGSGSVGEDNFETVKSFVVNVTEEFQVCQGMVQVGVVQYSHYNRMRRLHRQPYITTEVALGEFNLFSDFKDKMANITLQGWTTYTAHALNRTVADFGGYFSSKYVRTIVLVTDGLSSDLPFLKYSADFVRSFEINILAVGVASANYTELKYFYAFLSHPSKTADDVTFLIQSRFQMFSQVLDRPKFIAKKLITNSDKRIYFLSNFTQMSSIVSTISKQIMRLR